MPTIHYYFWQQVQKGKHVPANHCPTFGKPNYSFFPVLMPGQEYYLKKLWPVTGNVAKALIDPVHEKVQSLLFDMVFDRYWTTSPIEKTISAPIVTVEKHELFFYVSATIKTLFLFE